MKVFIDTGGASVKFDGASGNTGGAAGNTGGASDNLMEASIDFGRGVRRIRQRRRTKLVEVSANLMEIPSTPVEVSGKFDGAAGNTGEGVEQIDGGVHQN